MKKLFYFLPLLFISNLYADTLTPGPVGLTQPTTGAIDLKKSWAQKLNENFQAISTNTNATILTANNSNYVTITGAGIMQGGLGAKVVYSTNIADNTIQGTNLGYQIVLSSHIGANTIQGANISSATTLSAASMTVYAIFTDTSGVILGGSTITVLNVSQLATISSMTVFATVTSSTGFIGGSSTFTVLNITGIGGATFSSMTAFGTITSSSGFRGGSSTFSAVVVQTTITLPNSGATAGTYTNTNLTVNAAGLVVAAANGSGGGGGFTQQFTTHTIDLTIAGDVVVGTGSFNPLNVAWRNDAVSTFTLISLQAYTNSPSSITHTYNLQYSTGGTNPGGTFTPIHVSSFTISPYQSLSPHIFISTVINPNEGLSLWCTFAADPSSATTAQTGGSGIKVRGWKQP